MLREPRGVVAILMPWCDPLAASCSALAASLVAGNVVVLKPSEKAPLAAQRMVELLDLGDILQILHGDERAAQPLVDPSGRGSRDPAGGGGAGSHLVDRSTPAWTPSGRRRRSRRARSPAPASRAGRSSACTCTSTVAEPFLEALAARARALRIGPGLASGTELGPLIDDDQRVWVHRQVQDAVYEGAELLAGGEPLYGAGLLLPAHRARRRARRRARHVRRDARAGRRPSAWSTPSARP